jgi:hypothetical protein
MGWQRLRAQSKTLAPRPANLFALSQLQVLIEFPQVADQVMQPVGEAQ